MTAVHEAGHVVAAVLMGLDVSWASIDPTESISGNAEVVCSPGEPFAEAVTALAGMAAVSLVGGPKDLRLYRWGADFDRLEEAAAKLSPHAARRVGRFTLELLHTNWGIVRRVSDAMLDRPVLDRNDIRRLVLGSSFFL